MELVAKCIRQERTVELWTQFRAARAARDAREHIERLERLEKAARDLAALSNDRQDRGEMS